MSLSKKVNPYKACNYGLCRDFFSVNGYVLGTKIFKHYSYNVIYFESSFICFSI
nr:MAG TPA: hypothetical protein [Caudoviricetes sp.]